MAARDDERITPGYQKHVADRVTMLIKRLKVEMDPTRNGDPLGTIARVVFDAEYFRGQLMARPYPDSTIRYTIWLLVKRVALAEEFANNSRGAAEAASVAASEVQTA